LNNSSFVEIFPDAATCRMQQRYSLENNWRLAVPDCIYRFLALIPVLCALNTGEPSIAASATERTQNPSLPTGFVYHADYLKHNPGRGHPERPARLQAITRSLKNSPLWTSLTRIEPLPADEKWVLQIHQPQYLRQLERAAANAPTVLDPDTTVSSDSYRVALLATGGALAAVDAIMDGRIRNAFVASRPPGHHAFPNLAAGFCLINHIAVATRYVQEKYGLRRVLIIDWDVHHGNATQDLFYSDASVLYFSTHQYPYYPGTGSGDERGSGPGLGTNINVPLPAGAGDAEVLHAFETKLVPAAAVFKPEFVLISAGFDSHVDDPLAQFEITTAGFAELTKIAMRIADQFARGRLVSILEGGYNLENLASAANAHVSELAGVPAPK
jgi:acetoin utilization deacetylase AcuC-like enzyme